MDRVCEAQELLSFCLVGGGSRCPREDDCLCHRQPFCPIAGEAPSFTEEEYQICDGQGLDGGGSMGPCEIRRAVETLANHYLATVGVCEPPVPTSLIATIGAPLKIEVRELPLKVYHGATWHLGNEWVIQLRAREAADVTRYTVFHEAFHIACRSISPGFKRSNASYRGFMECLADYFAASILMPKQWVRGHWEKVRDVPQMARIFEVPQPLMRAWLTRIGLLQRTNK